MRYLDLFSGLSAASVAWHPLGWQCVGFSEIEPLPCAVLKHHYPGVQNLGDITKITDAQIAALGHIDLIVGGSPCQDLSRAGKRAGLAGDRSSLFHEQMRIFNAARSLCGTRFLLWENVVGAFSSNAGADFAAVVGAMAGLEISVPAGGWGHEGVSVGANGLVEWGVLDAQFFHVAQRRRRVFCLLDTGDWANRAPVLLERESQRGSRPQIEVEEPEDGSGDDDRDNARASGTWWDGGQVAQTLDAVLYKKQALPEKNRFPAVLVPAWERCSCCDDYICNVHHGDHVFECACPVIDVWAEYDIVPYAPCVLRYITPIEAERLQGFPDDYTLVPFRGKVASDTPRYKAIGNSFAVPVLRHIGERIDAVTHPTTGATSP